ncbi:MAG: hypothetical protein IKP40_01130 [Clostridia bacterium]|nr:hypothetical protein [Clostridia bacterium]
MRTRRSGQVDPTRVSANISNDDGELEIDIVELMYRLLEKMHLIVIAAVIGGLLMGVYTFRFATPRYQATSKLYILNSKDSVVDLTALNVGSKLASDYQEVFNNWEVHNMVIQQLGLKYTETQISGMVKVSNPSDTRVLYITCTSTSAQEACDMANTYSKVAREFIQAKMGTEQPNVFEDARVPTKPSSPNNVRNIIIGILLGGLLAGAIVVIQFVTDDRVRTTESIEKHLGLTTLGMMPLQAHGEAEDYGVPLSDGRTGKKKKGGKKE